MSLQSIINSASSIIPDRRRQSASTVTRSGILRTTSFASHQPWTFTVEFGASLQYSQNRDLLEDIDRLGITEEVTIDIGTSNPRLAYITQYRGNASSASLNSITVNSFLAGGFLYLNCSNVSTGSGFLFRKGDYVQPRGTSNAYRHPYTVTSDISLAGAAGSANVAVPVNRRVFEQPNVTISGSGIKYGSNVSWPVKMLTKPSYQLLPYDRVVFTGEFQLIEVMKDFYE